MRVLEMPVREGFLDIWVIYDHPRDYPDFFVVRRWYVTPDGVTPDEVAVLTGTLEKARGVIPPGKTLLAPYPDDDEKIAEVYV